MMHILKITAKAGVSILMPALIVALVVFAANNADNVTVSLWPFSYELAMPLYLVVILSFLVGMAAATVIRYLTAARKAFGRLGESLGDRVTAKDENDPARANDNFKGTLGKLDGEEEPPIFQPRAKKSSQKMIGR